MTRRYTLTDCYELLQVDPKTFRNWIKKAGIVPPASKADDRVKYLTQEQLEELAELHERVLPQTIPHEDATIAPGAYKLLVDQLDDLQRQVAYISTLAQQMNTSFPAQLAEQQSAQETTRVSLDTFHVLVEHRLEETQQAVEDQLRQQEEQTTETRRTIDTQHGQLEGLADLYNAQKLEIEQIRTDLTEQLTRKLEEHQHQIETLMTSQHAQQEALHDELQRAISQQFQQHTTKFQALLDEEHKHLRETADSLTAQVNAFTEQFTPLLENQQVTEQKLKDLERMLTEERQAREAIASHVAVLSKRRQPTKTPKPETEGARG